MYEQVYDFNARPFTSTPFVKHYFAAESIEQSLGQTRICIDRASGPVIVVGSPGSGKSLMLAMLEDEYQTQFNVVNLGCARLDERRDLWQSIMFELKLPFHDLPESELRFALLEHLKPSERCPNGVLLLIDEAHSLPIELLDELRLITNFVRDGIPRLRLVMAGNQQLEEHFTHPKLASFNQRIAARCYLTNMNREETSRYVTEHIERAGGTDRNLFTTESLKTIHEVSDGCPRLINQVCDLALILAGTRGDDQISDECIQEAWADIQSLPGIRCHEPPFSSTDEQSPSADADEDWTVIEFGHLDGSENSDDSPDTSSLSDQEHADQPGEDVSTRELEDQQQELLEQAAAEHPLASIQNDDASPVDTESASLESNRNRESEPAEPALDVDDVTDVPCLKHEIPTIPSESPAETPSCVDHDPAPVADHDPETHAESHAETHAETEKTDQTIDPFNEPFAEEEYLVDRFAPFVAHHNLSSLSVTAQDLKSVAPDKEVNQAIEATPPDNQTNSPEESEPEPHQTEPARVVLAEPAEPPLESSDLSNAATDNPIEIEQQAEEVLQRLQQSQSVSCETDDVDGTNPLLTNTGETNPMSTDPDSEFERQNAAIEETQQILNEILEQKQLIADQQTQSFQMTPVEDQLPFNTFELPEPDVSDPESPAAAKDDREMIIVSRADQQIDLVHEEVPPIPFPATPVSTGRAERMDYQDLFDQLRKSPDDLDAAE